MMKRKLTLALIAILAVAFACLGLSGCGEKKISVTFHGVTDTVVDAVAGKEVELPANPVKIGYTFEGWFADATLATPFDEKKGYEENTEAWAKFAPKADTAYRVEYYLENAADDDYTLDAALTENKTGTTDTSATATPKTIEHFTYDADADGEVKTGKIEGDGSLVLKLYYARNTYTVTYKNGTEDFGTESVKYQGNAAKVGTVPSRTGYTFSGWKNSDGTAFTGQNITGDVTVSGTLTADTDTGYKVEHYTEKADGTFELNSTDNLTGTTDTAATATEKTMEGFAYLSGVQDEVKSGNIAGDGSLVLKLYYASVYELKGLQDTWVLKASDTENFDWGVTAENGFGVSQTVTVDDSAVRYGTAGTYSVTFTYVASYGSVTATKSAKVYTQPTISEPIAALSIAYPDFLMDHSETALAARFGSSFTAKDCFDLSLTVSVKANSSTAELLKNTDGSYRPGEFEIVFTATDAAGQTAERTVTVTLTQDAETAPSFGTENYTMDVTESETTLTLNLKGKELTLFSLNGVDLTDALAAGETGNYTLPFSAVRTLTLGEEYTLHAVTNFGVCEAKFTLTDVAPLVIDGYGLTEQTFAVGERTPKYPDKKYERQEFDLVYTLTAPDGTQTTVSKGESFTATEGVWTLTATGTKEGKETVSVAATLNALSQDAFARLYDPANSPDAKANSRLEVSAGYDFAYSEEIGVGPAYKLTAKIDASWPIEENFINFPGTFELCSGGLEESPYLALSFRIYFAGNFPDEHPFAFNFRSQYGWDIGDKLKVYDGNGNPVAALRSGEWLTVTVLYGAKATDTYDDFRFGLSTAGQIVYVKDIKALSAGELTAVNLRAACNPGVLEGNSTALSCGAEGTFSLVEPKAYASVAENVLTVGDPGEDTYVDVRFTPADANIPSFVKRLAIVSLGAEEFNSFATDLHCQGLLGANGNTAFARVSQSITDKNGVSATAALKISFKIRDDGTGLIEDISGVRIPMLYSKAQLEQMKADGYKFIVAQIYSDFTATNSSTFAVSTIIDKEFHYWTSCGYHPENGGYLASDMDVTSNTWRTWGLPIEFLITHYDSIVSGDTQILAFYFYNYGFNQNTDIYMTGMTFVK